MESQIVKTKRELKREMDEQMRLQCVELSYRYGHGIEEAKKIYKYIKTGE